MDGDFPPYPASSAMINLQENLVLTYPKNTLVQPSSPEFTTRQLFAYKLRNLAESPLTIDEYLKRPFLIRGQWLLLARDIVINKWRQFYLASSKEFSSDTNLRIGLYDRSSGKLLEARPMAYSNTKSDRILLAHTVVKYRQFENDQVMVGIFAEDSDIGPGTTDEHGSDSAAA